MHLWRAPLQVCGGRLAGRRGLRRSLGFRTPLLNEILNSRHQRLNPMHREKGKSCVYGLRWRVGCCLSPSLCLVYRFAGEAQINFSLLACQADALLTCRFEPVLWNKQSLVTTGSVRI